MGSIAHSLRHPSSSSGLWFSINPSKRWGEMFFLLYTPFWLTLVLGILVPFKLYEDFDELGYMLSSSALAIPSILIPLIFVGKADRGMRLKDRYWVKATLWILIFSYVGNYFLTHYYFTVLGVSYTFPAWKMNNVPHSTFLISHVCFLFYHVTSNITTRRLFRWAIEATWILVLANFIALLETLAIVNFPHYEFVDRDAMYKVGTLFNAMHFLVSFPMFMRIDGTPGDPWNLYKVAIDALGASMLVTIILGLWRIFQSPMVPIATKSNALSQKCHGF
ncbi:hypothetical protein MKW98_030449 [Papaver atlanticum]|uniref:Cycloeucalenol cycloisomerase n=1 Tax=Papaver atlanticum TaxID=357466 RepID=A0AAD4XI39_9MAGN|nr:hypothetical protein MKW98_030449 [Papaver atlanticum]